MMNHKQSNFIRMVIAMNYKMTAGQAGRLWQIMCK